MVSHDRYFMDKVVDHIFEYQVNGVIKDFPGNYTQLREKQLEAEKRSSVEKAGKSISSDPVKTGKKDKKTGLTYKEKQEFVSLSEEIEQLESEKNLIESEMNGGNLAANDLLIKSKRHGEIAMLLDNKEMRWLELSEK